MSHVVIGLHGGFDLDTGYFRMAKFHQLLDGEFHGADIGAVLETIFAGWDFMASHGILDSTVKRRSSMALPATGSKGIQDEFGDQA
jgi:hypothetical protein